MGPLLRGVSMALPVLLLVSTFAVQTPAAQTPAPAAPAGATPVWTARFSGDVRWQQVTPAGALLVSTDNVLAAVDRSEEHTSELQSRLHLVCRLLLEKKKKNKSNKYK